MVVAADRDDRVADGTAAMKACVNCMLSHDGRRLRTSACKSMPSAKSRRPASAPASPVKPSKVLVLQNECNAFIVDVSKRYRLVEALLKWYGCGKRTQVCASEGSAHTSVLSTSKPKARSAMNTACISGHLPIHQKRVVAALTIASASPR
jgi:hypothetical protein